MRGVDRGHVEADQEIAEAKVDHEPVEAGHAIVKIEGGHAATAVIVARKKVAEVKKTKDRIGFHL